MRLKTFFQTAALGELMIFCVVCPSQLMAQTATDAAPASARTTTAQGAAKEVTGRKRNPLRNYKFTNELGQPVSLSDFHGQALALTFFFTRCPMPNFCPRLSKNFQEASQKLSATGGIFTNWHFLSVTFDPEFDTPSVLKAYAKRYNYDPHHWSFLTGPRDKIDELAKLAGVKADPDGALINHNFRTLIIDAANRLQMVFPTSGDLSDEIAKEMLKAVAATNQAPASAMQPAPTGSGESAAALPGK